MAHTFRRYMHAHAYKYTLLGWLVVYPAVAPNGLDRKLGGGCVRVCACVCVQTGYPTM